MGKIRDTVKKFFDETDSGKLINIVIVLAIGAGLILFSGLLKKKEPEPVSPPTPIAADENAAREDFEARLEIRLEQLLSQIDGAGKVKAMATLTYGKEITLAQDRITEESVTKETDSEGGVREVTNSRIEIKNIIITENGKQKPLIVKEIQPKVEGVIIVAEGGGKAVIKEAIVSSVSAALGIDAHKVHVLKMK